MKPMKNPRPTKTWFIKNKILLGVNWSKSWDGWASDQEINGTRIRRWYFLSIEPFQYHDHGAYGVIVYFWRLTFSIGVFKRSH